MSETMRRWSMDAVGRGHLKLEAIEKPRPGPGEILVRVTAASLNYRDKMVIETGFGLPLGFPFTPASDMAGIVEAVGVGSQRFRTGDRVISTFIPGWISGLNTGTARVPPYHTLGGVFPGVLAEYVVFPEAWFTATPKSLDDVEASTLPVAGLTAWFALMERGGPLLGTTVLVQGTGGVSLFGLQLAKAAGARVIVTSSSAEKLVRAKALGADHGIDRSREDWVEAVYRLTDDRGADHILEIAGGAGLGQSVRAAAMGGHVYVIGVMEGFELSAPAAAVMLKGLSIQGIGVGHRDAQEDFGRAIDDLGLRPVIEKRYAFADLQSALDHLDRGPFGKIVIDVA